MTNKKITSIALVCGLITASTGCVYQAELTEFLDDPTGMKAEAEMTAEYESPPDDTKYTEYTYETEYPTEAVTELPQVTEITETAVTTISTTVTTVTDISELAEEETEITTSAETDDIIFASAEPTEETEPVETEPITEPIAEEETEPPADEPTKTASEKSDYQIALEIYEYMTANGAGTCVQHSYQTYRMCREYGLPCYFIWTENKLYSHVANAVCVEGVWYVLDTQAASVTLDPCRAYTFAKAFTLHSRGSYIAGRDRLKQFSSRYESEMSCRVTG